MEDKYIRKLITFKNDEKLIFSKPFGDLVKNYKKKNDIILSSEELEILDSLDIKGASSYLKHRYYDNKI